MQCTLNLLEFFLIYIYFLILFPIFIFLFFSFHTATSEKASKFTHLHIFSVPAELSKKLSKKTHKFYLWNNQTNSQPSTVRHTSTKFQVAPSNTNFTRKCRSTTKKISICSRLCAPISVDSSKMRKCPY